MRDQSGNALFLVFIGIALFAALSYAVSQFEPGDDANEQELAALASRIAQYGTSLKEGIARIRMANGCEISEISFEPPPYPGSGTYYNAGSPTDYRCHVFHDEGGRVPYATIAGLIADVGNPATMNFIAGTDLEGVGTWGCGDSSCVEVYMLLDGQGAKPLAVCEAYNKLLKNTALVPVPSTTHIQTTPAFAGSFSSTNASTNALFTGLKSFCYNDSLATTHTYFVQVLIER